MARTLETTKLVRSVRQRAMIPDDTSTFTDDDIIAILNEEIDAGLLTTLLALNEEHLVYSEEVSLTAGVKKYAIPYRAVGNKLRDVAAINGSQIKELSRISLESISDYDYLNTDYSDSVFYVEGNDIVLVDSGNSNFDRLRFYYYLRPNVIVKEKNVGTISNIDTTTGVITLVDFPSAFSSLGQMDFVAKRSPNKIYKFDVQPTTSNQNTRTITFTPSDLPSGLMVGDYICNREETPVPNLPTELHPVLAQRAAIHILEALGDNEGLNNARLKLLQMEQSISSLIDNRVEGAPQKIKPRHSPLVQSTNHMSTRRRR